VIWSLLTGRLVREKVDPAVLSAVESQVRVPREPRPTRLVAYQYDAD